MSSSAPERLRSRPWMLAGLLTGEGLVVGALVARLTVGLQPNPPWSPGDVAALTAWMVGIYGAIGLGLGLAVALADLVACRGFGHHKRTIVGLRLAALLPVAACAGLLAFREPTPLGADWPASHLEGPTTPWIDDPPPVVLLVIDGADLDDRILPLVEAGQLPTFEALMRDGTWGELASLRPTRSPVLWTSIITGQPRNRHGIPSFVHLHLAGVDRTLRRFPTGTGFNQKILPRLNRWRVPGLERAPYTRRDWLARPLWDIVAEHHPIGVYRWLVTWPAEPTRGFLQAGGVYAGLGSAWTESAKRWEQRQRASDDNPLDRSWHEPPELFARLGLPVAPRPVTPDEMARYVAPGTEIDVSKAGFSLIAQGLREPAGHELPLLIEAVRPKFVAANVFTVDGHQHIFAGGQVLKAKRRGDPDADRFAPAVDQRYRDIDAELGRLLVRLDAIFGPEHHVVIVSDHGFDFTVGHHMKAPPGVFFGRGPAFAADRRVDSLGLLDIAPLCLDLLGLPLADDMPGASSMTYRQALDPEVERPLPPRIPTWERARSAVATSATEALTQEQEEQLRSLGYLD